MYSIFEFLLRLLGFGITFYYLLEYILTCSIDTRLGLICMVFICTITIIFFKFYTCNNVTKCSSCQSTIIKKNFMDTFKLVY
jgi:hypothetical protein